MSAEPSVDRARIYVSFADEDRARAMELVRWLNDSGWKVVADDQHSFAPGETWSPPRRLSSCDVVLCMLTPGWLVSSYHHEFSYCAKLGKFVLPVVCELSDLNMLPKVIRALPRIGTSLSNAVSALDRPNSSAAFAACGLVSFIWPKSAPTSSTGEVPPIFSQMCFQLHPCSGHDRRRTGSKK
jgi:hypothetical protein